MTSRTNELNDLLKKYRYSETMMHMLKGCLGAGLLAMPNAVSRMGLVFGVLGIMIIGFFATYCIQLLVLAQYRLCKKMRRGYISYTKSMRMAVLLGPKFLRGYGTCFSNAVDSFLLLWQIGICAIYLVFVAQNLKQIFDYYAERDSSSIRLLICYFYPAIMALTMVKDLKLLAPISTISNGLVMLGLLFTLFYLIEDDPDINEDMFKIKGLIEIPIFIGITLFALEAVGVILALEYNLEKPKEFTGMCGLFSVGMIIILTLYIILGVCGYIKYGKECKASITLNLPQDEKRAQAVKVSFAVALFLSFPLQNFVAWEIVWRLARKRVNNDRRVDYFFRVVCGTVPFLMAIAAPNLGAFMGLLGALCLTVVAILFPAVMDICVYYPDNFGKFQYRLIRDLIIIFFGIICCGSGCYTSFLEMMGDH